MKSVFLWIILSFYFTTINPKTLIKKLSFDDCDNDSWKVANVSLVPYTDRINVTADIAYGNKSTNVIHKVKLTLTGCNENFKCINHTDIVVGDSKCGTNVTELDKEACDIAETLAEWQLENEGLKENETNKKLEDGCIHYDTKLVKENVNDTIETNETVKTHNHETSERMLRRLHRTNFTRNPLYHTI